MMRRINKAQDNDFEPFIILPQGTKQEGIYWGTKHTRNIEAELLAAINSSIGNTRLTTNVIRVLSMSNKLLVVHLFPTTIKEPFSGRSGLKVVIGFIINKKLVWFSFSQLMKLIISFFNVIINCCSENTEQSFCFPDNLMRKSESYLFLQTLDSSIKQSRKTVDMCNIAEDENKPIVEVYKNIRKRIIISKKFCYIDCDNKFNFIADRKLKKKLLEMIPAKESPCECNEPVLIKEE